METNPSSAQNIYAQVRAMAVNFDFKPQERINEGSLAAQLGTSRTPLREALNRLSAEGFLTFQQGKGFFCRSLDPQQIMDLYEARQAVECQAVRLATERASDIEIAEMQSYLADAQDTYHETSDAALLVELDETFHQCLTAFARNKELDRMLANLNARIRYVRLIDMEERRLVTNDQHAGIIAAMASRDGEAAARAMGEHIAKRSEEATEAVRIAYAQLYVPKAGAGG